mgnify:CR=1 FL=1
MRFRVFRWTDALTFGLAAVLATVGLITAALTPQPYPISWDRWLGFGVVVALFWAGYIKIIYWRSTFRKRITYTTRHGVYVIANEYPVGRTEFEATVQGLMFDYTVAFHADGEEHDQAIIDAVSDTLVIWMPYPFEKHRKPQKLAGLFKPHRKAMLVGYTRPLTDSALGHEFGHLILEYVKGDGSEDTLRKFTKKHGLPY